MPGRDKTFTRIFDCQKNERSGRSAHLALVLCWLLCAAFFRIHRISRPEPFVDEAIGVLASVDSDVRALIDPTGIGRPLLGYIFRPALLGQAVGFDLLLSARALSMFTGLLASVLFYLFLRVSFGKNPALVGLALWAVTPLLVLHERLALQDPFADLLAIASLLLITLALHSPNRPWRTGLLFGAALAWSVGVLVKMTSILSLAWLPFVSAALTGGRISRPKISDVLALLFGLALPLLLLHDAGRLGARLGQYSAPPFLHAAYWQCGLVSGLSAALMLAATSFTKHVLLFYQYLGIPGAALVILSFVLGRDLKSAPVLRIAVLAALLGSSILYSKLVFGRYLMLSMVPILTLIAYTFSAAESRFSSLILACSIIYFGVISLAAVRDPLSTRLCPRGASLHTHDYCIYAADWPSGKGANSLVRFFEERAAEQPLIIVTNRWSPEAFGPALHFLGRNDVSFVRSELSKNNLPPVALSLSQRSSRPLYLLFLDEGAYYDLATTNFGGLRLIKQFEYRAEDDRYRFLIWRIAQIDEQQVRNGMPEMERYSDGSAGPKTKLIVPPTERNLMLKMQLLDDPELADCDIEVMLDGTPLEHRKLSEDDREFAVRLPASERTRTVRIYADKWNFRNDPSWETSSEIWPAPRFTTFRSLTLTPG